MIRYIYEAMTARKYRHTDSDIGLLLRVSGNWRVESPSKTLGVSVKIPGSNRFGPSDYALKNYKRNLNRFETLWQECVKGIVDEVSGKNPNKPIAADELLLLEILFQDKSNAEADFLFCFNIASIPNEYCAVVKDGEYTKYFSLYPPAR